MFRVFYKKSFYTVFYSLHIVLITVLYFVSRPEILGITTLIVLIRSYM